MTATIQHAWLQKHPSPAARDGRFHWYPADGDPDLRAQIVERMRGIDPPAILWAFAPGLIAWAQVFATTSPADGRRYSGLVLTTIADGVAEPATLLAALEAPMAAPWGAEIAAAPTTEADRPAIARTLLSGTAAAIGDPGDRELPRTIAAIERLLPTTIQGSRRAGVWRAGPAAPADPIASLLAAAARDPGSQAAQAWTLVRDLADARGETCDELAAALGAEPSAALTVEERASVPATDLVAVLHAWGRGRLDRSTTAQTLTTRLADLVARRIVARVLAGADPNPALAEVRWHAMLPAPRRAELLAAVALRTGSLRAIVEAHHA